jgi:malonate decarboxylase alpha subunit
MTTSVASPRAWNHRRKAKADRLAAVSAYRQGKVLDRQRLRETFEALLRPGDRVALEGDNQKQADFLSRTLAECDPQRVHGLHMLIGSVSRPEHLDLFEHLDFRSFRGLGERSCWSAVTAVVYVSGEVVGVSA